MPSTYETKANIRDRDGYVCTKCGMTNEQHQDAYGCQLDVHRLVPGSLYSVEGCITVCKSCHGKLPRRKSGEADLAMPPSRANLKYLAVPRAYYEALEEIAQESSTPDMEFSVAWAGRIALRRFLEQEGRLPSKHK